MSDKLKLINIPAVDNIYYENFTKQRLLPNNSGKTAYTKPLDNNGNTYITGNDTFAIGFETICGPKSCQTYNPFSFVATRVALIKAGLK